MLHRYEFSELVAYSEPLDCRTVVAGPPLSHTHRWWSIVGARSRHARPVGVALHAIATHRDLVGVAWKIVLPREWRGQQPS